MIAIAAVAFAVFTFQPAVFNLAYETNQDMYAEGDFPPDLLTLRDTLYTASLAIPAVAIGVGVLWAFVSTQRRQD